MFLGRPSYCDSGFPLIVNNLWLCGVVIFPLKCFLVLCNALFNDVLIFDISSKTPYGDCAVIPFIWEINRPSIKFYTNRFFLVCVYNKVTDSYV